MANNIEQLQAYLAELNARRDEYIQKAPRLTQKLWGKEKGPGVFNETSFLYIRSHTTDVGVRPLGSVLFWNSPDINIFPAFGTTPLADNSLNAGQTYTLQCDLHNRGDVMVPYPKVEFFLTNPTLGFDVRFAAHIGTTQMNGLLLANGNGSASINYTVPASESGHKCLFARTFSFSPLDKPFDIYALDPRLDRHIGQKNLNIVPQTTPYMFSIVHLGNASEKIEFVQLGQQEILALGEKGLGEFKWKTKMDQGVFKSAKMEVMESRTRVSIKNTANGFDISSQGKGMDVKQQAALVKSVNNAIKEINAGKAKFNAYKELFQNYRKMNDDMQKTSLRMQLPAMNLKAGEAVAWNIINTNNITKEIKGGITLIVTQL